MNTYVLVDFNESDFYSQTILYTNATKPQLNDIIKNVKQTVEDYEIGDVIESLHNNGYQTDAPNFFDVIEF
jgi:hypothetical protein